MSDLGVALQATIRSCAVLLPLEFVEGDSCAHLLLLDSASMLETLVRITGGTLALVRYCLILVSLCGHLFAPVLVVCAQLCALFQFQWQVWSLGTLPLSHRMALMLLLS